MKIFLINFFLSFSVLAFGPPGPGAGGGPKIPGAGPKAPGIKKPQLPQMPGAGGGPKIGSQFQNMSKMLKGMQNSPAGLQEILKQSPQILKQVQGLAEQFQGLAQQLAALKGDSSSESSDSSTSSDESSDEGSSGSSGSSSSDSEEDEEEEDKSSTESTEGNNENKDFPEGRWYQTRTHFTLQSGGEGIDSNGDRFSWSQRNNRITLKYSDKVVRVYIDTEKRQIIGLDRKRTKAVYESN